MTDNHIYKEDAYRKFAEELPRALEGPNIKTVDLEWLEPRAKATGVKTKFGSYGWRAAISSRIAPKTVYLGGKEVRLTRPSVEQKTLIAKSPDELDKVLHLLRTLPFYHIRRQMGENQYYNPNCNLYVSSADLINYRLGYMWGTTMFKPSKRPGQLRLSSTATEQAPCGMPPEPTSKARDTWTTTAPESPTKEAMGSLLSF